VRPLLPGSGMVPTVVTSRRRLDGLIAYEGATMITLEPFTVDASYHNLFAIRERVSKNRPSRSSRITARRNHSPPSDRAARESAQSSPSSRFRVVVVPAVRRLQLARVLRRSTTVTAGRPQHRQCHHMCSALPRQGRHPAPDLLERVTKTRRTVCSVRLATTLPTPTFAPGIAS
jgi:hypothetical protein